MIERVLFLNPFTILALFFSCLFLYKRLIQSNSTTTKSNLPPSPPRLPIIGNLHQLTSCPHRGLFELSRKYGDIMLLHLGSKPVLVISSANSVRHIMKTHDVAFSNRPQSGTFYRLLYQGKDIATAPYGEYWRQIKSIFVLQLLSNHRVRSFSKVREEEVCLAVENIRGLLKKEVNMSEVFLSLMKDIICRVAYGKKYGRKSDFRRLLNELMELLGGFYVGDFIPWLGWISWVSGLDSRVVKVVKEFDDFLEEVIKEHEEENKDKLTKDFVDVLLEFQRDETIGFPLERDSIKAITLDAFVGGTDTTFTVLEWTMSELLRHPRSMEILQAEVRQMIGSSLVITDDDLHKMKYLKATIKESIRLHPPAPLLAPRESTQDVELNGYTIPMGTQVITNAWAIQRDPTHWADPNEFYPERFLDTKVDFKGHDFELIPFGTGRRGCPGISFAITSIEFVLASLLWKFDWSLPEGSEPKSLDMKENNGITLHRKNPLILVPTLPN